MPGVYGDTEVDFFRSLLLLKSNGITAVSLRTQFGVACSFKSLASASTQTISHGMLDITGIARETFTSSCENYSFCSSLLLLFILLRSKM